MSSQEKLKTVLMRTISEKRNQFEAHRLEREKEVPSRKEQKKKFYWRDFL